MHGAGIISMGYLMDAIADTNGSGEEVPDTQGFATGLKTIKDYCRWTEGTWDLGDGIPRRWNDVQNTPRDIQRITDFLVSTYYGKQGSDTIDRVGSFSCPPTRCPRRGIGAKRRRTLRE